MFQNSLTQRLFKAFYDDDDDVDDVDDVDDDGNVFDVSALNAAVLEGQKKQLISWDVLQQGTTYSLRLNVYISPKQIG